MRDSEDPGKAKQPRAGARPPDPGGAEGTRAEARIIGERQQPPSQDSIVAETQDSQVEDEKQQGSNQKQEDKQMQPEAKDEKQGRGREAHEDRSAYEEKAANLKPNQHERTQMPAEEDAARAVLPQEMFTAVVAEMAASTQATPKTAWTATIAELFAVVHDSVSIDDERVPSGKRRYPKLKGEEKAELFKYFRELCVVNPGTYEEWTNQATKLTQKLYNTSWTFKNVVQRMISQVKWDKTQPLNQWAAKVKGTQPQEKSGSQKENDPPRYEDFMFNPSCYKSNEIAELRAVCEQPAAANSGRRLREGSAEEWRIISGLAEGTVVCRRQPDFLKSILDSKECVRLYRTIQRQVEGELQMQLRGQTRVHPARDDTQALQEDILTAGEVLHMNTEALRRMLGLTKTISYNHVQRSIHLFFFDRASARHFQAMSVPYNRTVYHLVNVHPPDTGSVWARQLGRDGTRPMPQREYEVHIRNVTRFTDIGRLTAYLQQHITAAIGLEDMDTCTPYSRTSTTWKLTIKTAECPDFLRGIVRIMWYGRSLVLEHPDARRRFQCLRCGNMGHPIARCRYSDSQLTGSGSQVATDQEVAQLEDLAQPFASFEEVKRAAAKRLAIQEAADRKVQEAVQPHNAQEVSAKDRQGPSFSTQQRSDGLHADKKERQTVVDPAPQRQWIAVPKGHGRTLFAHKEALQQLHYGIPSRFADLQDQEEEENADQNGATQKEEGKSDDRTPTSKVIDITSDGDVEEKPPPPISASEKAKLHLVNKQPPKDLPEPQLVALKQRERQTLQQAIDQGSTNRGEMTPLPEATGQGVANFFGVQESLQLHPVTTPASGNCMAMALAQALADQDLADQETKLEEMTKSIKRGIQWTGQLGRKEQFDHFLRTSILVNVDRGWQGMDAHESSKQFRWYLHEYATSPSDTETFIPRYNWGCSDLMAMAANFLQRKIFVLAFNVNESQDWHCSMFQPSIATKGRQNYDTGEQIPLKIGHCIAEIRKEKLHGPCPPLVLRYWGNHYSAFVHARQPYEDRKQDGEGEYEDQQEMNQSSDSEARKENEESDKGESQEVWRLSQWDGDIEELRRRLMGLSIPHELQCEIHLILEQAEPERYVELLAFLVNTASQIPRKDRDNLLAIDVTKADEREVRAMLQKYQISVTTLQQWQVEVARETQEEQQLQRSQVASQTAQSGSEYTPSSTNSSQISQMEQQPVARQLRSQQASAKRNHTLSPIEGEEIRQMLRTQNGSIPKHQENEPMPEVKQDQRQGETSSLTAEWGNLWEQLAAGWPATAKVPFPRQDSRPEEWIMAAQHQPHELLQLLQSFAYPAELLESLNVKVLEAWTMNWRKECLLKRLTVLRSRTVDRSTQGWLDDWTGKLRRPTPLNLTPLIDNRDDWKKLRSKAYGEDTILKLCDSERKSQFAQYLMCALLYEQELQALVGSDEATGRGPLPRLMRHLTALTSVPGFKAACSKDQRVINWLSVAHFFSSILERVEEGQEGQY